jgi:hypothetical protein
MRRKRLHLLNVAMNDFIEDTSDIVQQIESKEASTAADNAVDSIDLLIEPFELEDDDSAMNVDP